MKITCHFPRADEEIHWVGELQAQIPGASVTRWSPGDATADYAVCWRPSTAFLAQQSGLKALFNAGAGVDALLAVPVPLPKTVIRLEDAGMAEQMGEYVAYAALRHLREFDRYATSQAAAEWAPRPARRKADFPVGVLGLGVLGTQVATTLRQLGFPVHAWTRSPRATAGDLPVRHGLASLPDFLRATQILVCLLPLTPETTGLLDHDRLALLPQGAYVVNVARGGHIDDDALLAAIDRGHLSGAMLDVFHDEPLPASHPYWRHPRITVTPHISAATLRDAAVRQIAGKVRALEAGQPVTGVVDTTRGY